MKIINTKCIISQKCCIHFSKTWHRNASYYEALTSNIKLKTNDSVPTL